MSPDVCTIKQGLKREEGAGLPIALFIITVLSLLVLTMADLQDSSSQSVSLQIQSQRAFFAAETGAQIALTMVLPGTEHAEEIWARVGGNGLDGVGREIEFDSPGLDGCVASMRAEKVLNGGDLVLVEIVSTGTCAEDATRTVKVKVR